MAVYDWGQKHVLTTVKTDLITDEGFRGSRGFMDFRINGVSGIDGIWFFDLHLLILFAFL
jgi:hypothetical protein